LAWKDGKNEFEGIGIVINDDMLAASFELVAPAPAKAGTA
jgi:hypothetical protein